MEKIENAYEKLGNKRFNNLRSQMNINIGKNNKHNPVPKNNQGNMNFNPKTMSKQQPKYKKDSEKGNGK